MSDKTTEPVAQPQFRTLDEARAYERGFKDGFAHNLKALTDMASLLPQPPMLIAAPSPTTEPCVECGEYVEPVLLERMACVYCPRCGHLAQYKAAAPSSPQTTPTQDEILALMDELVDAQGTTESREDAAYDALAAAVGRLAQNCAEWKQAAEHALSLAESNHERAEKAERERDTISLNAVQGEGRINSIGLIAEVTGSALLQEKERTAKFEADAKRYQWLRERSVCYSDGRGYVRWEFMCDPPSVSALSDAEQADAAIDAAMTEKP